MWKCIVWVLLVYAGPLHALDTLRVDTIRTGVDITEMLDWQKTTPDTTWHTRITWAGEQGSFYVGKVVLINDDDAPMALAAYGNMPKEMIQVRFHGDLDTNLYNGNFMPYFHRANLSVWNLLPFTLPPNSITQVEVALAYPTGRAPNRHMLLVSEREYLKYLAEESLLDKIGMAISLLFMGGALVLMLYTLFLYFQNRKERLYLFYSGYLFFALWYFGQKLMINGPYFILYPQEPLIGFVLNEPLQFFLYICYNLFIVAILDLQRHAPRLTRLITGVNMLYLAYAITDMIYVSLSLDGHFRDVMYPISRVVVIGISLYLLVQIIRVSRSPLLPYIILGTFFFMLFSILAMLFSLNQQWVQYVPIYPINWMHIGIFLEALFFSLAMGYRIRLNTHERQRYYRAYAEQLRENQRLIEEANLELNRKVEERTQEVLKQAEALEKAKADQLKSEYERKVLESDLNTLRLQMNPHFIFNSLNSIRYYILKQESPKAAEFIADFARLLRMVLHHSKQKQIRLSEEIEALDLYLAFERERLSQQFDYHIEVEEAVSARHLAIQPLMIQPFVENAVWHGLSQLKGRKGQLKVHIAPAGEEQIAITVEDNGIGREAARTLAKRERKSYGLDITKQRMEALNKITGDRQSFSITDLTDDAGQPLGTRVTLWITRRPFAETPIND
mgnify:CR=1 FL=1